MKDKQLEDLKKYAAIASANFHLVEQSIQNNRHMEAAAMRSALESALKVYWIYRWDCYDPTETLHKKINYLADKGEFNIILINHMHMIRTLGNQQLHEGEIFDIKTANDLFDIFKKCIQAISEKVGIDLMKYGIAESKNDTKNINMKNISTEETNMYKKENFWIDFQKILNENGGEYSLEFINNDMARVKYKARLTPLVILPDSSKEKVFLFEKSDMQENCITSINFNSLDLESLLIAIDAKCKETQTLQPEQCDINGKILYKLGQVWEGQNYTDLINKIFHRNYKKFQPSTLNLKPFEVDGTAWLVVMNGLPHGRDGDLWINRIIENEMIVEEYVGFNKDKIHQEFLNYKIRTFSNRLVFQRDPYNSGNDYQAKCLGFYTLKSYDTDKLIRVWKRQSESLLLNIK